MFWLWLVCVCIPLKLSISKTKIILYSLFLFFYKSSSDKTDLNKTKTSHLNTNKELWIKSILEKVFLHTHYCHLSSYQFSLKYMLLLFISLLVNSIFMSSTGIFILWYNAIDVIYAARNINFYSFSNISFNKRYQYEVCKHWKIKWLDGGLNYSLRQMLAKL